MILPEAIRAKETNISLYNFRVQEHASIRVSSSSLTNLNLPIIWVETFTVGFGIV